MISRAPARLTGEARLRPWRLGLVIDVDSETEVLNAIDLVTHIWGGPYFPLLDSRLTDSELLAWAWAYDLDSVYVPSEASELMDRIKSLNLLWVGHDSAGPFDKDKTITEGLLPAGRLANEAGTDDALAAIVSSSESKLLDAALFGSNVAPNVSNVTRLLPIIGGPLVTATRFVRSNSRNFDGFAVINPQNCRQISQFWNYRAAGAAIHPIVRGSAVQGRDVEAAIDAMRDDESE